MRGRCRVRLTRSSLASRNTRSNTASPYRNSATRMRAAAFFSRLSYKTSSFLKGFQLVRQTTRFSVSYVRWRCNNQAAQSYWCQKTSICASRRARWDCPLKSTSMITYWKIPTCFTRASCSCRMISGTSMAKASSPGKRTRTAPAIRITG